MDYNAHHPYYHSTMTNPMANVSNYRYHVQPNPTNINITSELHHCDGGSDAGVAVMLVYTFETAVVLPVRR